MYHNQIWDYYGFGRKIKTSSLRIRSLKLKISKSYLSSYQFIWSFGTIWYNVTNFWWSICWDTASTIFYSILPIQPNSTELKSKCAASALHNCLRHACAEKCSPMSPLGRASQFRAFNWFHNAGFSTSLHSRLKILHKRFMFKKSYFSKTNKEKLYELNQSKMNIICKIKSMC